MTEIHGNRTADETPTDRLIRALADPGHLFDAGQVVYLMAAAARWQDRSGVLAEVAELNLDAIARAVAPSESKMPMHRRLALTDTQRRNRAEADQAAGHPWLTDHPGGAVADWDADRPTLRPAPISVRVVRDGSSVRWAEAC